MSTVAVVKIAVTQHAVRGKQRWVVSYLLQGKRVRRYFDNGAAAKTYAGQARAEVSDHGSNWLAVPPEVRGEILDAFTRAQAGGVSLREAALFFEQHRAQKPKERISLKRAVKEYLRSREEKGLRTRSQQSVRYVLNNFTERVGDVRMDSIDTGQIQEAAGKLWPNPSTRRTKLIAIKGFFRFGIRRGWLETSPADRVELPLIETKPPAILTAAEARELIALVGEKFSKALPMFAVMLYAGLRPAEAERIRWEDIRLGRSVIVVETAASKIRGRRLVTIQPILARILGGVAPAERTGRVRPRDCKRTMRSIRTAWGRPWHQDVLRHSFVSYHVAAFEDVPKTALEAGHSVDVLMRHYRELVSPEEATKFWAAN